MEQNASHEASTAPVHPNPLGLEAPRLAASTRHLFAGSATDAQALRHIVEVQAEDLVRLRRELVSARNRLSTGAQAIAPRQVLDQAQLGAVSDEALLAMLRTAQAEIELVTQKSRWLRLGRRLGLARPISWEDDDWRSPFVGQDATSLAGASASILRGELMRLARLQDELSRSRWRQLGHRLRLSKPMSWDMAERASRIALPPARDNSVESPSTDAQPHSGVSDSFELEFVAQCKAFAVDAVLDVGANRGQFGLGLRRAGWLGHIVSIEPLSEAHAKLRQVAQSDALWDVVDRCALGATPGEAEINIAANSWSSSLLPMAELHREAAPGSAYEGREPCHISTLDEVIANTFSDQTTLVALKIDTQGYEMQVLEGLRVRQQQVCIILCELSLAELYEGGPDLAKMCSYLAERGYRCISLTPEFEDPQSGRLLQVNGLFVVR